MQIPTCPTCAAITGSGDAFCATCGARLPAAHVRRPSARRSAGWGRRLAVTGVLLLVVVAAAVTGIMLRASSAVGSLHTVSPPPASVPRSAFGLTEAGAIDTAPARAATGAGDLALEVDPQWWDSLGRAVAGVPDTVHGVAVAAGAQSTTPEPMTILLLGVDARPGEPIDIAVRADAIAVLRLDPNDRSCRLLAIPRDTRTELPGYGQSKVNHALAVGGIPYQVQVIEQLLGLDVDHYALADVRGFADVVDMIGGVTIDISEPFTIAEFVFEPGERRLTGDEALAYVRFRGGPDGDFGRISRQQHVLRAIAERTSGLDLLRTARELLPAVEDHLRTDLSPLEISRLIVHYQAGCGANGLEMDTLRGSTASFADPLVGQELSFVVVEEAEIRAKVAALLGAGD
jgi:LCP family protein required for cell wall assembly